MKKVLICPSEIPAVRVLSEETPLAATPLLGQTLVEYWLSHLASSGARDVTILAHDRPDQIRGLVGDGARWGLSVEVTAESREPTAAQVLLKFGRELVAPSGPVMLEGVPSAPNRTYTRGVQVTALPRIESNGSQSATVLNHLPGQANQPLFASYANWFAALIGWTRGALTPDRVGIREVQPGIWIGLQSRVSRTAQLRPPCWLGRHVYVGAGAVVGPQAILEDGAFIEAGAELVRSWVRPNTLIGRLVRLSHSLACGDTLVHWPSGSVVRVPDPFLLYSLRNGSRPRTANGWLARLSDLWLGNREELGLLWKNLSVNKEG
jgi:acetyltransferase-like isoleucine patch superfamily enzyme